MMNKTALLINGVSLPYDVLDKSLAHAKDSGTPVKAVFIYENVDEEEYELPAAAEVSKADFSDSNAARNLEELIEHNTSYVETFFANNDIACELVMLKNPTINEISDALKDVGKICIDHETFMHPDEFAYVDFTFEDLEERIGSRIEWCGRRK
jgi:hypothetical protein